MEFSEAARTNAIKFLRQFAGTSLEGDGAPPLRTNWPTFSESELEGECLDMGRVFLAKAYQYPLCKAVLHVIDHVKNLSMICPTCNTWGSMGGQEDRQLVMKQLNTWGIVRHIPYTPYLFCHTIYDREPASVKESSRGARLLVCESLAPRDYTHTANYSREGGGCPGILSYHISAVAYQRLKSSVDEYRVSDEGGANEDTPTKLDSELVAKGLLDAIRRVCEEWADSLPELTAPGPGAKHELSLYAMKNTRRKMEDKHALCVDVNSLFGLKGCPPHSFYAVFDGHIGVEAAAYASVHLLPNIVRHPLFLTDTETAIREAFLTTDERFCEKQVRAGTTVVLVLLRAQTLYVGWLGDSQAFLVRKDKPISLVEPHKPEREDERERIEAAGGMVVWIGVWRVNGNLSVSRAIGDPKEKKYVIGEPDVKAVELDGSEDYLVLACDGVWDVVNGEELVECVRQHQAGGGSRPTTAKAIIDFAKSEGSGDNMTCIVVFPNFENGVQDNLKGDSASTTHSS